MIFHIVDGDQPRSLGRGAKYWVDIQVSPTSANPLPTTLMLKLDQGGREIRSLCFEPHFPGVAGCFFRVRALAPHRAGTYHSTIVAEYAITDGKVFIDSKIVKFRGPVLEVR